MVTVVALVDNFCIALFSGVHKLTAHFSLMVTAVALVDNFCIALFSGVHKLAAHFSLMVTAVALSAKLSMKISLG